MEQIREYGDIDIPESTQAMLMVELDGDQQSLAVSTPLIEQALNNSGLIELKNASTEEDKQQAKARAKQILQGHNAEEVLNARPDDKLMEKVEQEIAESSDETDLLDSNSPQE